jgi:diguanylate cyclase (GGDEF)-like protein
MSPISPRESDPNTDIFPLIEGLMDLADPPQPSDTAKLRGMAHAPRQDHRTDKARQAIRLRRLLLVCVFAELYLLVLIVFYAQAMITRGTLIAIAVAVSATMLGLYGIFASGLNQKAKEKNLTAPIALAALAIILSTVYAAPRTHIVFTPFAFVVVAYGMYRLPQKAMLLLCGGALAGYAGVIALHDAQGIGQADTGLAWLHWFVLAVTLPGFYLLAGRVRRLHSALHKAGLKIRNIEEHARRDQLLGCYNRRYMIAALEEQKRLADETGAPLCLAVIDLDHFKSINDEVGHLAGDEVLRVFARIAQENVRQNDVFGRYGGEEFLLVLPETPLLAALNTAERIREQVEHNCWQGKLQRTVTVSIGLTQYIPGESVLDLFSRTDTAMYLAKRGGRNQVVVEEPSIELWQAAEVEMSA